MAKIIEDYFYFGKVLRTHGYKGGLKIKLEVDDTSAYKSLKTIFIEIKGSLVPYFIENIHFERDKANLKLQDVNSLEKAGKFQNFRLFLPASELPALKGKRFYFHEVIGFEVNDEKSGPIGIVEDVIDVPGNALLQVRFKEKEILIPAANDIILKVDRKKKRIDIRAPEGLIDLYLK
jgi:16S rRNA processing protein RimM